MQINISLNFRALGVDFLPSYDLHNFRNLVFLFVLTLWCRRYRETRLARKYRTRLFSLSKVENLGKDTACAPDINFVIVVRVQQYDLRSPIPPSLHPVGKLAHWFHLFLVSRAPHSSGQPEVTDLDLALHVHQNVLRLDIPMCDVG